MSVYSRSQQILAAERIERTAYYAYRKSRTQANWEAWTAALDALTALDEQASCDCVEHRRARQQVTP